MDKDIIALFMLCVDLLGCSVLKVHITEQVKNPTNGSSLKAPFHTALSGWRSVDRRHLIKLKRINCLTNG